MSHTLPSSAPAKLLCFASNISSHPCLNFILPFMSYRTTNHCHSVFRSPLLSSSGFNCDLLWCCCLHDCYSNTTSPAPLLSINLYTLPSLRSLPLHRFSLIALWYLARSNGLWAQIYILVTWSFSSPPLCMSVAAPLEQRGSIFIQSTPPSACASDMKSFSHEDEPWVSIHTSVCIWNFIYCIWSCNIFTTKNALTTPEGVVSF